MTTFDVQLLRYLVQPTEFFVILGYFLPFYPPPLPPPTIQKIKIFKIKKTPGYIIILQMSNIKQNHSMYNS